MKARQLVLASGILDSWQARFARYRTTTSSCQCPDYQVRGRRGEIDACKHILALRLMEKRQKENLEAQNSGKMGVPSR